MRRSRLGLTFGRRSHHGRRLLHDFGRRLIRGLAGSGRAHLIADDSKALQLRRGYISTITGLFGHHLHLDVPILTPRVTVPDAPGLLQIRLALGTDAVCDDTTASIH